ncbi:MAG: oxygen-independent coproporphyrinogen III oxidase [Ferruginibacter sp.]|nr:oxygen-independent coproporphyrinogen III oxidase [Ferruginibacter sp.]
MEEVFKINPLLIRKYNQQLSEYASYPTIPYWDNSIAPISWAGIFRQEFNNYNHTNGICIYIHLPFCESLCTCCDCNKIITTDHAIEEEYLLALEKEWKLYRNLMQQTPVIRQIHLGGGTPTFFSPKNLRRLISIILKNSIVHPVYEFSIEAHPFNTTRKHLEILYSSGFRRISYGIQDNDPEVQRAISRVQSFDQVKNVTIMARETGFTSVNFDLLYGLPKQTIESIEKTIEQVVTLLPDRVGFSSYNPFPIAGKVQGLPGENDLPAAEKKTNLYLKGKEMLMENGYFDLGMDHFVLTHDSLYKAWQKGKLHRNFMGYTTQNTGILLGLGVSGISDTGNAYAQNTKTLADYYTSLSNNQLAVKRGYILNEEDKLLGKNILDISCKGKTTFTETQAALLEQYSFPHLALFAKDGLVKYDKTYLEVTQQGHFFTRNICSALDIHLQRNKNVSDNATFSKAIQDPGCPIPLYI